MEITVNENTQLFYLAADNEWDSGVGHAVNVGEYEFCIVPAKDIIRVAEVTSGIKVQDIKITNSLMAALASKGEFITFATNVGKHLKKEIEKRDNFSENLKQKREETFERLGEKPPTEAYEEMS